ncbi:vWA domain-containing protein [Brevibacillus daliensis]|uniref:vWA domain-containing protein n=1 Tax=Brevibacillus daliensis TaxID=2892995 RepID=UPI001E63B156|nr:vWA domain-containing protein [Brevibacillus daliensis]
MSYELQATQRTPALIIYVIDVSGSMCLPMGEKRRIDVVMESLSTAIRQMIFRSTKGSRMSPRYRVAILAYSDEVYDLLDGIRGIDEVARLGVLPELSPRRLTDTAKAFLQVEKLLQAELPFMQDCPAPLICHMTDGAATGEDPEPIVKRIMQLSVPDGNVLVENIFISDEMLREPIADPKRWGGIMPDSVLVDEHAIKLQSMSSVLPESYREMMGESNYQLNKGALLMLPATSPELVSLGFQMSAATPVR